MSPASGSSRVLLIRDSSELGAGASSPVGQAFPTFPTCSNGRQIHMSAVPSSSLPPTVQPYVNGALLNFQFNSPSLWSSISSSGMDIDLSRKRQMPLTDLNSGPSSVSANMPLPSSRYPPRKVHLLDWQSCHQDEAVFSDPTSCFLGDDETVYEAPVCPVPPSGSTVSPSSPGPAIPVPAVLVSSKQAASVQSEQQVPHTGTFTSLYGASRQDQMFEGATVKEGFFEEEMFFSTLQDLHDRGIIMSFSHRAPSYDSFRVWLDGRLKNTEIVVEDASKIENNFFLVMCIDHAHQQAALQLELFYLNHFVDVWPWTPDFMVRTEITNTRPMWVELSNLHLIFRHKSTILSIAAQYLGPVLLIPSTSTLAHHASPRLLIRWNMSEKPMDFLVLKGQHGHLIQRVVFLNHPDSCYRCKRQGHQAKDCLYPPHFADYKPRSPGPQRPVLPPAAAPWHNPLPPVMDPQVLPGLESESTSSDSSMQSATSYPQRFP